MLENRFFHSSLIMHDFSYILKYLNVLYVLLIFD